MWHDETYTNLQFYNQRHDSDWNINFIAFFVYFFLGIRIQLAVHEKQLQTWWVILPL